MDGEGLRAGAVTFVKNIKNPVGLARLVMERSNHILLAGEGANQFADEMGIDTEPDEYFFTEHRWLELQEAMAAGRVQLDHSETNVEEWVAAAGYGKPIGTVGRRCLRLKGQPGGCDVYRWYDKQKVRTRRRHTHRRFRLLTAENLNACRFMYRTRRVFYAGCVRIRSRRTDEIQGAEPRRRRKRSDKPTV